MRAGPPRVHSRFPLCRLTLPSAGLAGLQTSVIEGVSQSGHTKKRSLLEIYLERLFEVPFVCLLVTSEPKCCRNVRLYKIYVKRMFVRARHGCVLGTLPHHIFCEEFIDVYFLENLWPRGH